jgi:hypothetical protein
MLAAIANRRDGMGCCLGRLEFGWGASCRLANRLTGGVDKEFVDELPTMAQRSVEAGSRRGPNLASEGAIGRKDYAEGLSTGGTHAASTRGSIMPLAYETNGACSHREHHSHADIFAETRSALTGIELFTASRLFDRNPGWARGA